MKTTLAVLVLVLAGSMASAKEFHVSVSGSDGGDGSAAQPFKTISAAAQVAQPGDVITVHEGTYRERVTPPRGGESDAKRIVYQAVPGEKVVIKGSEVVTGWKEFKPGVWKVTLPNSFFGKYNPYKDIIVGDWFDGRGRPHHTGEVYLNGKALFESHILQRVLDPKPFARARDPEASKWTWYCESDMANTYIYANFHDKNPNEELVEINVRDSCFYPDKPGRNYITVRGFQMCHAATQWAAPTAEQPGLIGTHWSKGWIIENNVISDSKSTGITLGKDRATGHNAWGNSREKDGAKVYTEVVQRALKAGWSRDKIGSHIVRNNTISYCDQAGICGSLGAAFSQITGNHIYNTFWKRQYAGAEMAGIKLHAAIDVVIKGNRIHGNGLGLWMDWMAQGTRISGNLCYDNDHNDLFVEVDHGPFVVDNNLFLSPGSLLDLSQGGAYVHNLFAGRVSSGADPFRRTPYHLAHSTAMAGLSMIRGGDNRFYNNLFIGEGPKTDRPKPGGLFTADYGMSGYDNKPLPLATGGNLYYHGARPYGKEVQPLVMADANPKPKLSEQSDGMFLEIALGPEAKQAATTLVTTALLGKATIPQLPYENADGSPLVIDTDYLGVKRDATHPTAGPFENPGQGNMKLKVW